MCLFAVPLSKVQRFFFAKTSGNNACKLYAATGSAFSRCFSRCLMYVVTACLVNLEADISSISALLIISWYSASVTYIVTLRLQFCGCIFFSLASVSNNVPWNSVWVKLFAANCTKSHIFTQFVYFYLKYAESLQPRSSDARQKLENFSTKALWQCMYVPNKYQPIAHWFFGGLGVFCNEASAKMVPELE